MALIKTKSKINLKNYGKKTILIIDDDLAIRESLQEILELEDYAAILAANGQDALDLLKSLPDSELPDLILLDYQMPIMDGQEFNQARLEDSRLVNIPTVLITANGNIGQIMKRVDADGYIDKPVDMDDVLRIALHFIHHRNLSRGSFLT